MSKRVICIFHVLEESRSSSSNEFRAGVGCVRLAKQHQSPLSRQPGHNVIHRRSSGLFVGWLISAPAVKTRSPTSKSTGDATTL